MCSIATLVTAACLEQVSACINIYKARTSASVSVPFLEIPNQEYPGLSDLGYKTSVKRFLQRLDK